MKTFGHTIESVQVMKEWSPLGTTAPLCPSSQQDIPSTSQHTPHHEEGGRGRQGRAWESPPPPNNCPRILPINTEFSAYTNSALEMQMRPGKIKPMDHSEKNEVLQRNHLTHTKSFTQGRERALGVVIGRGWGQAASGGGGSRDLGSRGDSGMREWLCP